jgi:hypothetical protein
VRKEVSDFDFEVRDMSPCDPIFWVVRGSDHDSYPYVAVCARDDCLGDMTDSISAHCLSPGCERTDLAATIAKLVLWRNIARSSIVLARSQTSLDWLAIPSVSIHD